MMKSTSAIGVKVSVKRNALMRILINLQHLLNCFLSKRSTPIKNSM